LLCDWIYTRSALLNANCALTIAFSADKRDDSNQSSAVSVPTVKARLSLDNGESDVAAWVRNPPKLAFAHCVLVCKADVDETNPANCVSGKLTAVTVLIYNCCSWARNVCIWVYAESMISKELSIAAGS